MMGVLSDIPLSQNKIQDVLVCDNAVKRARITEQYSEVLQLLEQPKMILR